MAHKYLEQLLFALFLILILIGGGAVFFMTIEGWGFADSIYFTGITLLTIGYGDMVPTHVLSKIATVIFGFLGIGIVFYSANILARRAFEAEEEQMERLLHRKVQKKLAEERKVQEDAKKEAEKIVKDVEKQAEKMVEKMVEGQK